MEQKMEMTLKLGLYKGLFPKITGTSLGIPVIKTIVYWGLYWGTLNFRKLPDRSFGAARSCKKCEAPLFQHLKLLLVLENRCISCELMLQWLLCLVSWLAPLGR